MRRYCEMRVRMIVEDQYGGYLPMVGAHRRALTALTGGG